jgi:hypothetical protein
MPDVQDSKTEQNPPLRHWERVRRRLSYSNVMATIAVFFALGGGAYAASSLPVHSVGTKQLKPGAVGEKQLKDRAITRRKLAPGVRSLPAVQDTETSAMTLGSKPAVIASIKITPPAATNRLLTVGDLTFQAGKSPAVVQYQVVVDGKPQGPAFTQDLHADQTAVAPVALLVELAPGRNTVQILAESAGPAETGPVSYIGFGTYVGGCIGPGCGPK